MPAPICGMFSRLSVQLSIMLALALVPIGIFGVLQTRALEREARAHSNTGLMGETVRAAQQELAVINRAEGVVAALAQMVPQVLGNVADCTALMTRVAATEDIASLVAFMPADGQMRCASTGRSFDFSDTALFTEVRAAEQPYFVVNPAAPVSGTSVLGVSHPVLDAQGQYLGYATVSLPHSKLRGLQPLPGHDTTLNARLLTFWTFDSTGKILTSSRPIDQAAEYLPAQTGLGALVGTTGLVFQAIADNGHEQTYAVVPIVPGKLYMLSSWKIGAASVLGDSQLGPYVPTLLMWLAALLVAYVAANRLVTRHVQVLNNAIRRFADGDRRLQTLSLPGAPQELRELGAAFASMTESITHGEARLEDGLHRKKVLLREVHHRVKNNLQLIASIMNIQMRKARSPEAKVLLKGLQDRVMSLATIHRGLYQTSGMVDVHAEELFSDIVRQVVSIASGGNHPFTVKTDVDDIRLVPDQAVPLSLLMTEALTNAIKHSGSTQTHPADISVSFKRAGGSGAVLEVSNSVRAGMAADSPDPDPQIDRMDSGLGSQLITAFAQQLGGQLELRNTHDFAVVVRFEVAPLAAAEVEDDAHTSASERGTLDLSVG